MHFCAVIYNKRQSFLKVLRKSGCIRPSKSQFGTIFGLKTSVCADLSQHLYECINVSLQTLIIESIGYGCYLCDFRTTTKKQKME